MRKVRLRRAESPFRVGRYQPETSDRTRLHDETRVTIHVIVSRMKEKKSFQLNAEDIQASSLVAAGIGLAVVGFAGRYLLRRAPNIAQRMTETAKMLDSQALANSKYYKGGFESRMTKREASLILGVSPTASKSKVKEQFKKVMSVNHPDRGGSPYIAAKINEAKDLLEK